MADLQATGSKIKLTLVLIKILIVFEKIKKNKLNY